MLGRYSHHIVLAALIGSVLVASSIALANSTSASKVIWMTNPVTITFSHTTGHGSTTDSLKCAPPVIGSIVTTTSVSPSGATLSTDPSGFATCGPSFQTLTLNALSTTPGTYRGIVTVSQLSLYESIPPSLTVTIVVT